MQAPKAHHLRFDAEGHLIGVTLLNAKRLLDHDGEIVLTLPERVEVGTEALDAALTAA